MSANERGLVIEDYFARPWVDPWECAGTFVNRDARIAGDGGRTVFEQRDVLFPESWGELAVNVVASKYFRGKLGTTEREDSLRKLVTRVTATISTWGWEDGYFRTFADAERFAMELVVLVLSQRMAFNTPVWMNVGVDAHPQTSACFINSVEDSMESILNLAKTEGMIFKKGSGAGVNLSNLRAQNEALASGGTASGPVSFMRGYDAFAGAIKSGGICRRAAKMVILNVDHPDIMEFIECKAAVETRIRAALESGLYEDADAAYADAAHQNANHSVRVSDAFMNAVVAGGEWDLRARTDGKILRKIAAREVFQRIVRAAWECGDPGMQFDDTINTWNTLRDVGRINSSNPCTEFMALDDSACNLASLNLRKFQLKGGFLAVEDIIRAVELTITAQDILIDRSSYPTESIRINSQKYRPLGLGYANLGAYTMVAGNPYDSNSGRREAAAITALMTGAAYAQSARLAGVRGTFSDYPVLCVGMRAVLDKHYEQVEIELKSENLETDINLDLSRRRCRGIIEAAKTKWLQALELGLKNGYRNSQTTLLAPTGTIAFMMDADTTGIEPDVSLRKRKVLAGGGEFVYTNKSVRAALENLGYTDRAIDRAEKWVVETGGMDDCPEFATNPLDPAIFDCAFAATPGGRAIPWEAHVKMVAAVQPFLSGAVSKTINLRADATMEDVAAAFELAWRSGLKAVAIYRDGCKQAQPLTVARAEQPGIEQIRGSIGSDSVAPNPFLSGTILADVGGNVRRRLPIERNSITHKFDVAGHEGYVTAGMYPDGRLGEIFVVMSKQGSTIGGLLDAWATAFSVGIQWGVPLEVYLTKFRATRFEPAGFTRNPVINSVTSVLDYLVRWIELKFPNGIRGYGPGDLVLDEERTPIDAPLREERRVRRPMSGPPCADCGAIMEPNGACWRCPVCGTTNGCG